MLEDQKDQMALLKTIVEQNIAIHGCRFQDFINFDYENRSNAKDLIEWLREIDIDENSIKKVAIAF